MRNVFADGHPVVHFVEGLLEGRVLNLSALAVRGVKVVADVSALQ